MRNLKLNFDSLKCLFAFILLASVSSGVLPIRAQTKRGAAKTAKVSEKKIAANAPNDAGSTAAVFPKPETSILSEAWQSGELPQPLALPEGNTDEVAAILARKVAARNAESVPALLTALQLAGFFITDKNGQMLHTPPDGKGQGLPINGWEVASVARMYGDNRTVNLAHLDKQLKSVPVLRGFARDGGESVGAALLEGVRANADNTRNPYLRVWARFIIELGKNSDAKYDLTSGSIKADAINLDVIQHLLIVRRLYGDFWATAEKYNNETVRGASENRTRNQSPAKFVKADFSRARSENSALDNSEFSQSAAVDDDSNKPSKLCRLDGDAPTIADSAATTIGMVWDEKLDKLVNSDDPDIRKAGSRRAGLLAAANVLLAYAKFIQTYAALETTITAEDSAPLIRTRNTIPGGRKKLQAFVRLNIGKWQDYNCLRMAMNVMTGIDFSTMNDGPLGGVGVQWSLTTGGAGDFYSNSTGVNESGEQIVGFAVENPKRIQDKGVAAGSGLVNFTFNKTSDKGTSETMLVGTPQKNEKKSMRVWEVNKQARVVTSIEIKPGEIKGDLVDVYGQAADLLPGLLYMPVELLYRTSWAASGALIVPVVDWEECGRGWSGTISITRKKSNFSNDAGKGVKGYTESVTSRNYEYKGTINIENVTPRASGDVNAVNKKVNYFYIDLKGESSASSKTVWESSSLHTYRDNCGSKMTTRTLRSSNRHEESGSGQGIADGNMLINLIDNKYSFNVVIPAMLGKDTRTEKRERSGYCDDNKPTQSSSEASIEIAQMPIQVTDGILDPDNPNVIEGSRSYTASDGEEFDIRWSFRNCRQF